MTPDAVRRVLRTGLQMVATAITGLSGLVAAGVLDARAAAVVGAVLTFLLLVATAGMNTVEDRTGKALLIPKANPDPEPTQPPVEGAAVPDLAKPATRRARPRRRKPPLAP